jgi:hypothetical protein
VRDAVGGTTTPWGARARQTAGWRRYLPTARLTRDSSRTHQACRTREMSCKAAIWTGLVSFISLFAGSVLPSQVLRLETGVLGDASQHPGTQLVAIVKRKREVRPAFSRQRPVGARLALDDPEPILSSAPRTRDARVLGQVVTQR